MAQIGRREVGERWQRQVSQETVAEQRRGEVVGELGS